MAIDEADRSESDDIDGVEDPTPSGEGDGSGGPVTGSDVRAGEYTWAEFMEEHGYGDEVDALYDVAEPPEAEERGLESGDEVGPVVPGGDDWTAVTFAPEDHLGFHPDDLEQRIREVAAPNANVLWDEFESYADPDTTPVVKGEWTWEHFKWEYYYEDDGSFPRDDGGEIVDFDAEDHLGFDPDETEGRLSQAEDFAQELDDLVEERTVNVQEELDEDDFFSTQDGHATVTNRYDLEKAVPMDKKKFFSEVERYWVNKPYAFVIIFHSKKENETKYYAVEPHLNRIETNLQEFLTGKLRNAIKYSDDEVAVKGSAEERRNVLERETRRLLERYDLFSGSGGGEGGLFQTVKELLGQGSPPEPDSGGLEGIEVRPEPAVLADDPDTLNEYQVEKFLYLLKRDFIGYERIDPIKHDINVEDISCDGYESPVFVYHEEYEQIITNVVHGKEELDDFVVKLAQRSGKGISKRRPQVDATLPDGSRAQLTLGKEVSDHGTNYTIRQFKDVPFTPIDLVNWNTFSLDEMAFLWLCIENNKSLIFAGGTASGKTTSLNAVSLFIPSNTKVVSIEDTREVELPQRNWVASVTRPSFSEDSQGDIDEFDLLEAALRQRPDYIVMGEVRGEEGRDLFQAMSTGHTTYTTFHADSVDEVLKRFTTDPINVSKTMFTALDLVSIQTQTRVQGNKVRRNKNLTEINHYDADNDEINVQDVYQWQAETDEFLKMSESNTLDEIKFDRGWNQERLEEELFKRRTILAYLIKKGLNTYTEVAATIQAFINDPDTILTLIANGQLEESLEDLREMESVMIDIDPEKEDLVPRPDPDDETYNEATDVLERAEESVFDQYRGQIPEGLASALSGVSEDAPGGAPSEPGDEFDFDDDVDEEFDVDDEELSFGGTATGDEEVAAAGPGWLSDEEEEGSFDFGDGWADETGETEASGASEASADAAAASPEGATDQSSGPPDTVSDDAAVEPADEDDADVPAEPSADAAADVPAEPSADAAADVPAEPSAGEASAEVEPDDSQPDGEFTAESDDEEVFAEPDDDASVEEEPSIFSEETDEGSLFTDDEAESLFGDTNDGGGGMFGIDEDEDDPFEGADGLFGGGSDDGDATDGADTTGSDGREADDTSASDDRQDGVAGDDPETPSDASTDEEPFSADESDGAEGEDAGPLFDEADDEDPSAGSGDGIFDEDADDHDANDAPDGDRASTTDDGSDDDTISGEESSEADDADEEPVFGDDEDDSFGDDGDEAPFGDDEDDSFGDDEDDSFGDDEDDSFGDDEAPFGDDADGNPFGDDADGDPFGGDGDDGPFSDSDSDDGDGSDTE